MYIFVVEDDYENINNAKFPIYGICGLLISRLNPHHAAHLIVNAKLQSRHSTASLMVSPHGYLVGRRPLLAFLRAYGSMARHTMAGGITPKPLDMEGDIATGPKGLL